MIDTQQCDDGALPAGDLQRLGGILPSPPLDGSATQGDQPLGVRNLMWSTYSDDKLLKVVPLSTYSDGLIAIIMLPLGSAISCLQSDVVNIL